MAGDWRQRLAPGLKTLGLTLPAGADTKLLSYVELLERWNRAYNLTAVRDPAEMLVKHVFDSLAVLPHVQGSPVQDVGSGAGLPGIPLALALPDTHFTLLDSNGKKTRFMIQAVAELKLANVTVVQARAEAYTPPQAFACIVSRAFASLADFVTQAGGGLAPGGRLLAMKGAVPEDEMAALPAGYRVAAVQRLTVPGLDAERCVVVVKKEAA